MKLQELKHFFERPDSSTECHAFLLAPNMYECEPASSHHINLVSKLFYHFLLSEKVQVIYRNSLLSVYLRSG